MREIIEVEPSGPLYERAPSPLAAFLESTGTPWGSTRWREFQRCEHAHDLKYRLDYFGPYGPRGLDVPLAMQIGSLVHAGLAAEASGIEWQTVLEYAREHQADRWSIAACAEAERLLPAYFSHYGPRGGWSEITGVEVGYQAPCGPLPYSGRPDLLVRTDSDGHLGAGIKRTYEPGRIWFVDHKTQAALADYVTSDELAREWMPRPQFRGVSWLVRGAESLDYFPGCVVDIIVKTKIPKFRRVALAYTEAQVLQWARVQERLAMRAEAVASMPGTAMPNYHECIDRYGKACFAYDACHPEEKQDS